MLQEPVSVKTAVVQDKALECSLWKYCLRPLGVVVSQSAQQQEADLEAASLASHEHSEYAGLAGTGLLQGLSRKCWASWTTARSACGDEERRGRNRVSAHGTKQP